MSAGPASEARELVGEWSTRAEEHTETDLHRAIVRDPSLAMRALPRVLTQEYSAQYAEQRAFTVLAARFAAPPSGGFFAGLVAAVNAARTSLLDVAVRDVGSPDLREHPSPRGVRPFERTLGRLALCGSRTDAALAVHADLTAWSAQCSTFAEALRSCPECPEQAVSYFATYAVPPRDVLDRAVDIAEEGLRNGDSIESARHATHEIRQALRKFWEISNCTP